MNLRRVTNIGLTQYKKRMMSTCRLPQYFEEIEELFLSTIECICS
jgi:hypothetical protein